MLVNILTDLSRAEIKMKVLVSFIIVGFPFVLQEKALTSLDQEEVE